MTQIPDDADRLEAMLRASRAGDPTPEPGPDCLDDGQISALVDGAVDPAHRDRITEHLARCAACRRAVASVAAALDDPDVRRAAAVDAPPKRRLLRFTVPAAAAAVLLLLMLGRPSPEVSTDPTHRAPEATAPGRPVAVAPLGSGQRPASLQWRSVPEADLYRVTLYAMDGSVLYARELRDTAASLPDSIELAPGRSYRWLVEARTGWNRWSASDLFEFSVAGVSSR